MSVLHLMKGLQASGKSTLAREIVRNSGNTVRVNRDDLRAMGFGSKWSRQREKFVVEMEKSAALSAARMGMNIVIDDTNLLNNIWPEFAREHGLELKVHDLTGVPVRECVRRDLLRSAGAVGPGVIFRMAAQAGLLPWTGRPVVVCDIDGTVADLTQRLWYMEQTPKDYKGFFGAVYLDTPVREVIDQVRKMQETHDVVFVSGRPDTCAADTWFWLAEIANLDMSEVVGLLMRQGGDHRPDDQVKEELLRMLPKERISLVIDDRPRVIAMWKRHGLNVQEVNQEAWVGRE